MDWYAWPNCMAGEVSRPNAVRLLPLGQSEGFNLRHSPNYMGGHASTHRWRMCLHCGWRNTQSAYFFNRQVPLVHKCGRWPLWAYPLNSVSNRNPTKIHFNFNYIFFIFRSNFHLFERMFSINFESLQNFSFAEVSINVCNITCPVIDHSVYSLKYRANAYTSTMKLSVLLLCVSESRTACSNSSKNA